MKWILTLWLLCFQSSLKVNLFVFLTSLSVGCLHFYWFLWFPAWVCHEGIFYTDIWTYYSWYFPWTLWVYSEKENEKVPVQKKARLFFESFIYSWRNAAHTYIYNVDKILSFKKINFLWVTQANCIRYTQLLLEWHSEYKSSTGKSGYIASFTEL